MTRTTLYTRFALVAVLPVLLVACHQREQAAPPPPKVSVLAVHTEDVPLQHQLVGRLAPTRVAEVRARVTGIVQKRAYTEGTDVGQDELLFLIDPAPLKATLDEKEAALKQALATAENNRIKAERANSLAERGVASKQDLDDASAAARASDAAVAQARAAVETARLDLSYTRVIAPIAGRAGRALVTEGALVSQSAATQLTTIEQIDPLYVNFSQPMEVVEQWRQQQDNGTVELEASGKMTVQLRLPDGSTYPQTGQLDFTDMRVDPDTGSVSLRATIANPDHKLLPGMFVNVELNAGTLHNVILVPQQALLRDGNSAYVLTVNEEQEVARTLVHPRGTHGTSWIIDQGLADGQTIIVSGLQQTRPGGKVDPEPWSPQPPSSTVDD